MDFQPFVALLHLLPPAAMRHAANHYRQLAFELESAADRLDGAELDRKRRSAELRALQDAASRAAQSIVGNGEGRTQALAREAAAIGADPARLALWLPRASRLERERVAGEVRKLALAGWRNAEIAARMKLHPASVSRIIGRLRKAGELMEAKNVDVSRDRRMD